MQNSIPIASEELCPQTLYPQEAMLRSLNLPQLGLYLQWVQLLVLLVLRDQRFFGILTMQILLYDHDW